MKKNLLITMLALAAVAPIQVLAFSDGYLEWTSIAFEDAAGWRVYIAESGSYNVDGFTRVSKLEVSRNGVAVEIPASVFAKIRNPMLSKATLLSVWGGVGAPVEVKVQIPVWTARARSVCQSTVWEIDIVDGRFSGTAKRARKDPSPSCG